MTVATTAANRALEFARMYPAEVQWLAENMEQNSFAASLAESLDSYGTLTDRQLGAVRSNIDRAVARALAPEVSVAEIEARFAAAKARQIKKPAMRLDTFVFKYAGDTGRNAGAIYVTDTEVQDDEGKAQYLGKVLGGKFLAVSACTPDQQSRVIAAAANPSEAAKAYGQRTGNCSICGRELTADESIDRFIGPICFSKYFA